MWYRVKMNSSESYGQHTKNKIISQQFDQRYIKEVFMKKWSCSLQDWDKISFIPLKLFAII